MEGLDDSSPEKIKLLRQQLNQMTLLTDNLVRIKKVKQFQVDLVRQAREMGITWANIAAVTGKKSRQSACEYFTNKIK